MNSTTTPANGTARVVITRSSRTRFISLNTLHLLISTERLWLCSLMVLTAVVLLVRLDVAPGFWFDEGYKVNAARSLVERGMLASYTVNGFIPFDPGTSMGPVDVVSIAASFGLLGIGIVQARLTAVLFSLLGLFVLYHLLREMAGWRASLFACLLVLAAPPIQAVSFVLLGRQALSEATAFGLIMLALWLMLKGWRAMNLPLLALAGIAAGLGVLSRQQWGLALGPALLIVTVLRSVKMREHRWTNFLPLVTLGLTIVAWKAVEFFGTPTDIRADNSQMALEAIRTNLITGLWGRTLTRPALLTTAVMLLAAGSALWRQRRIFARGSVPTDTDMLDLTLGLCVLLTAIWFALISVGWPRYAYAGLILAQVLIGRALWDGINRLQARLNRHLPGHGKWLPAAGFAALGLLMLGYSLPHALANATDAPQQAAAYIRQHIPQTAVIETWEWELDALSGHWEFHHPHQRYLFKAIRQYSHEQRPFDLGYNALEGDPDYLIVGAFSSWTHLYDPAMLAQHFTPVAEIGAYQIYQRRR